MQTDNEIENSVLAFFIEVAISQISPLKLWGKFKDNLPKDKIFLGLNFFADEY